MKPFALPLSLLTLAIGLTAPASAKVIVVSNRAQRAMSLVVWTNRADARSYKVAMDETTAIPLERSMNLTFGTSDDQHTQRVSPGSIYVFQRKKGRIELEEAPLVGQGNFADVLRPRLSDITAAPAASQRPENGVITIKLLVDDDEPGEQEQWEPRLRKRIQAASDIIEKHCGLTLEVIETGTWESDNRINNFGRSLPEFINKTNPGRAHLAVGFTSQFANQTGPTKLGGIPGPFFPYLLIREWPGRISEAERLEVLIHELGHYLGAAHSPDQSSCMRPVVGDQQANGRNFRLGYDPVNTLVLNLVAEEMRERGIRNMRQLRYATKAQILCAYATLAMGLPDDPAHVIFMENLGTPTEKLQDLLLKLRPRR